MNPTDGVAGKKVPVSQSRGTDVVIRGVLDKNAIAGTRERSIGHPGGASGIGTDEVAGNSVAVTLNHDAVGGEAIDRHAPDGAAIAAGSED